MKCDVLGIAIIGLLSLLSIMCLINTSYNSLCRNENIWWERSGSTLVQLMASCLTASSHYLNQCWIIIMWHSHESNFVRNTHSCNLLHVFRDYIFKITSASLRIQWVNHSTQHAIVVYSLMCLKTIDEWLIDIQTRTFMIRSVHKTSIRL